MADERQRPDAADADRFDGYLDALLGGGRPSPDAVGDRNEAEMFLIEGHTDAVGSDEDNLTLSDRRAESVADILVNEFGVPVENLVTQGYGEQYLKIETEAPERQNRRVAFRRITPLLGEFRDR